jgi:flavin-dependent dehydrogenase
MQEYITESPRRTQVMAKTQVLVVGGGSAGYSAAISAARQGADVLLLERYPFLGGMSTGGLVLKRDYAGPECPYGATGGLAHEVWDRIEREGGGFRPNRGKEGSEEFLDIHYGKLFAPKGFDHAPDTMVLDPEVVKLVAETMVVESGAGLIYGVQVVDTIVGNTSPVCNGFYG